VVSGSQSSGGDKDEVLTDPRCGSQSVAAVVRPWTASREEFWSSRSERQRLAGVGWTRLRALSVATRAVISGDGTVKARMDYTAFGEEIQAGVGLRTTQQGFGVDADVRQGYGMTERDDATGLDHTWFRKHENRAGRWTSPDPYNGSISLGDPQSFNRYSYVTNNPINFVDPSGLHKWVQICTLYHYVYVGGPNDGQHVPGSYAWDCQWVLQVGDGNLGTVEVSASDFGGFPPEAEKEEQYCNTSIGIGFVNIGYLLHKNTLYPSIGLGPSYPYPVSFSRTYGDGPVQTGLSANLTVSNGLAIVSSASASGFSREVGVGSPNVSGGVQVTGPAIPLLGSTPEDIKNNPARSDRGGLRFGGRCPY